MTTEVPVETERTFDAARDLRVPDLRGVPGVSRLRRAEEEVLDETYVDTVDLALAHGGITLRRRGGDAPGWHLHLPVPEDGRTEVHLPDDKDDPAPPAVLLDRVRAYVRDHPLVPVLTVRVRRVGHHLEGPGASLAVLCDDRVTATTRTAGATVESWREWRVNRVHGDVSTLDDVEALLRVAGALPTIRTLPLARVLAPRLRSGARGSTTPLRKGTTGDVWWSYVTRQLACLLGEDLRLRGGDPAGVHQMRVAARRLRSALATYADLLEPGVADGLREELSWLGGALAGARDAQVLEERLRDLVAQQPPDQVVGGVPELLTAAATAHRRRGRSTAADALGSERYFRLLDGLDALVAAPPYSAAAGQPAQDLLRFLAKDLTRVRRRHRDVGRSTTPHDRDLALHEVRKAAKRLRYAAETAQPVFGKRAGRLARRAEAIQSVLGEHQDSVVCRDRLREVALGAGPDGEDAFVLGRLHALEQARADELEGEYDEAIRRLSSRKLRRWPPPRRGGG